jgi:hypothetical protein
MLVNWSKCWKRQTLVVKKEPQVIIIRLLYVCISWRKLENGEMWDAILWQSNNGTTLTAAISKKWKAQRSFLKEAHFFAVVLFGSHPPLPSLTPTCLYWAATCATVHLFSLMRIDGGGGGGWWTQIIRQQKKRGMHAIYYSLYAYEGTLIKRKRNFLIYKEFQTGSVAMSYMRKGFLIHEEMLKHLTKNEEAVSHIWPCNRSLMNFLIYEENLIFYLSV